MALQKGSTPMPLTDFGKYFWMWSTPTPLREWLWYVRCSWIWGPTQRWSTSYTPSIPSRGWKRGIPCIWYWARSCPPRDHSLWSAWVRDRSRYLVVMLRMLDYLHPPSETWEAQSCACTVIKRSVVANRRDNLQRLLSQERQWKRGMKGLEQRLQQRLQLTLLYLW